MPNELTAWFPRTAADYLRVADVPARVDNALAAALWEVRACTERRYCEFVPGLSGRWIEQCVTIPADVCRVAPRVPGGLADVVASYAVVFSAAFVGVAIKFVIDAVASPPTPQPLIIDADIECAARGHAVSTLCERFAGADMSLAPLARAVVVHIAEVDAQPRDAHIKVYALSLRTASRLGFQLDPRLLLQAAGRPGTPALFIDAGDVEHLFRSLSCAPHTCDPTAETFTVHPLDLGLFEPRRATAGACDDALDPPADRASREALRGQLTAMLADAVCAEPIFLARWCDEVAIWLDEPACAGFTCDRIFDVLGARAMDALAWRFARCEASSPAMPVPPSSAALRWVSQVMLCAATAVLPSCGVGHHATRRLRAGIELLARTDTPGGLVFGSTDWCRLRNDLATLGDAHWDHAMTQVAREARKIRRDDKARAQRPSGHVDRRRLRGRPPEPERVAPA